MRAKLIESREVGPEVRHFVFEIPELDSLRFSPGQFVFVTAEVEGRPVRRAYSIASPPDGNRFELCLNRVREGLFSPFLFDLPAGGTIEMRGPYGVFTLRQTPRDSLMIATGTGIAPFRSMLRYYLPRATGQQFTLLFGVRYEEGLLYRGEFEEMAARYPNFQFWPALTRPGPEWHGRRGRVQQHLEEAVDGRRDLDIYICGLKEMVLEVRELLVRLGFETRRIIYERYD